MATFAESLKNHPKCCFKEDTIDVCDIYDKQKQFQARNHQDKREWLTTLLTSGAKLTSGHPKFVPLCQHCFRRYHGIKRSFFFSMLKKSKAGVGTLPHENNNQKKTRHAAMHCLAWLKTYARAYGDIMPDTGEVHLPSSSWKLIYNGCARAMEANGFATPSYAQFILIAQKQLPHVKCRKCKRFGKCTDCSKLEDLIGKTVGQTHEYWMQKKEEHNDWQMRERQKYYDHKDKSLSIRGSKKAVTLCVDTMDQAKSNLPGMLRPDKELEKQLPLQVHITGVMVSGMGRKKPMVFTWYDRFPASSNVLCTVVMETLAKLSNDGTQKFPPTLNLHLDNCWRENKNKYVFDLYYNFGSSSHYMAIPFSFPLSFLMSLSLSLSPSLSLSLSLVSVSCLCKYLGFGTSKMRY